jgi:hypothetical protein
MTSFRLRGKASSAIMMSLGVKLTALVCHLTKRVNKAEELTYFSTNIDAYAVSLSLKLMFSAVSFKILLLLGYSLVLNLANSC